MTTIDVEQRAAVLLDALGDETVDAVLSQLSPEAEQRLRERLQVIDQQPPDTEEIAEIIEEFDRVLQFALDAIAEELDGDVEPGQFKSARGNRAGDQSSIESTFTESDDAVADLGQLEAYQIAGGLQGESARTIAIVLDCLEPDVATRTLRYVSDELQSAVFAQLNNLPVTSPALRTRILRTTINRGLRVKRDALEAADDQKEKRLAEMLRNLDRKARNKILEDLQATDEDLVARIRQSLYAFTDIGNIEDRCLQKLLGEIETKTLCTALCGGPDEILNKITGNLSRRARESLLEEMSLMGNVPEDEQEAARKEITEAMLRLDQAGELVMVDAA